MAASLLDLYEGHWEGTPLRDDEFVISTDEKTSIVPFGRLVRDVMTQEPYRSARRVFWTMDNGFSHRGQACIDRIKNQWPSVVPVHTPVHASWLNQVEIYFSILQRKALTPNDFPSFETLEERLHGFARYYETIAQPFEWKFTRKDLESLLDRIDRARALEHALPAVA